MASGEHENFQQMINMKIKNHAVIEVKLKAKNRAMNSKAIIVSAIVFLSLLTISTSAQGQTFSLGAAQDFAVVSSQGITNSGATVITGNVALSPLTTITGFTFSTTAGEGVVTGSVHYNDTLAAQAQTDALAAFNTLAGLAFLPGNDKTGQDLGGMTLSPGVYHFDTSVDLTGNLTLATGDDPNAVFIFQIGSTLTTSVGSSITVTGAGAGSDPNVFWQVGSSATLGNDTIFDGNILAFASASLGTGADILNGRTIALNGAITLLSNNISVVPEPATWAMLFSGMSLLGFWNWQRRRYFNA